MKKLLVIAILMLALVFTVVACNNEPVVDETTAADTTAETPTEAPDEDATTEAPTEDATTEEPTEEATTEDATTEEATTEEPTQAATTEEPTTEEPTADPAEPVLVIDAEFIYTQSQDSNPTVANQMGACELITEGNRTFARLTANGGDPYVAIIPLGSDYTLPQYMAIAYRTNSTVDGQFFMGSGQGWTGAGDSFMVTWNEGDWSFVVVDLTQTGVTSITDGKITYARMDFFAGNSAEGDYFDVQYVAFFNTAEYAEAYDFKMNPPYIEADDAAAGKVAHSFDTFYVNGQMYFEQDGGAGDKLTAINNTLTFDVEDLRESLSLRGWMGFGQPIDQFGYFIDNYKMVFGEYKQETEAGVLAAGGENATRFQINVPLAELKGGTHMIGFVVKLADGTVVRLRENLTVIVVPYHEDEIIQLADRNNSVTPICSPSDKKVGQKLTVSTGFLKQITVADMATYADESQNKWTFKVWQWNTDYATTVAGTPLYEVSGENHRDNMSMSINIPAALMISGEIYYEAEYLEGKGGFTGWTAEGYVAEGLESYIAGNKIATNFASSIVVGIETDPEAEEIPEHQLQNAPVYILKAKDMLLSSPSQLTMEKMDGYNHFIPQGGDPNFMLFRTQTGSRYVAIKYRTEYTANIQIFLGSTGTGPVDDTTMMEQALIPDGEWHLAIFDTQTLVDRGVYDGSTAAYLRLDVMESGYECDANGDPIRDPDGTWHKLPLPAGATIDIAYFAFFESEEKANGYEYGGADTPVVENYNVPMDAWTVSGHKPGVTPSSDATHGGMVGAGGLENGALLHQGAVGVGEIDLSKYSKVIVYCGCDASAVTQGHYDANANNRIIISKVDSNMSNSPAEADIIASATYTLHGWTPEAVEIDLSGIDYNGPVYITYDTLPGTFMLVGAIEFVA